MGAPKSLEPIMIHFLEFNIYEINKIHVDCGKIEITKSMIDKSRNNFDGPVRYKCHYNIEFLFKPRSNKLKCIIYKNIRISYEDNKFWLNKTSNSNDTKNINDTIKWALTIISHDNIIPEKNKTKKNKTKELLDKEKESAKCNVSNPKGTSGILGENFIIDVLKLMGEDPKKITEKIQKGEYRPDIETATHVYEIKTAYWYGAGTAVEKCYGVHMKYDSVPEDYKKPLRVIFIAKNEYDLTYGKVKLCGKNISKRRKQALDMASDWGIEYIPLSTFILGIKKELALAKGVDYELMIKLCNNFANYKQ